MIGTGIRRSIWMSLAGHMALFLLFSFYFGRIVSKPDYTGVYFWGAVLPRASLIAERLPFGKIPRAKKAISIDKHSLPEPYQNERASVFRSGYLKPSAVGLMDKEKVSFILNTYPSLPRIKKDYSVMFYPQLPYNFIIYFKDRQTVHIGLAFNIISNEKMKYIAVKRKISSGNLEADLLSMRYINHYLFIQQAKFLPNRWQTVKIELSRKNDYY